MMDKHRTQHKTIHNQLLKIIFRLSLNQQITHLLHQAD